MFTTASDPAEATVTVRPNEATPSLLAKGDACAVAANDGSGLADDCGPVQRLTTSPAFSAKTAAGR
jgi:hypothetical protein